MFDLEARLLNRSFTIALIQEPYILRRNPCLLPSGWKRFYLKDSSCRALILCSPDLQVIAHGALTKRDICSISVSTTEDPLLFSSVYCDITLNFDPLTEVLNHAQHHNIKVILGVDSNAHSSLWGPGVVNNARGNDLEEILFNYDVDSHNRLSERPTFENTQGHKSFIDITLTHQCHDMISEWRVVYTDKSDHNYIFFDVDVSPVPRIKQIWCKTDWKEYKNLLEEEDWSIPDTIDSSTLEEMSSTLVNRMQKTLDVVGLRAVPRPKSKDSWARNVQLAALRRRNFRALAAHRRWNDRRSERLLAESRSNLSRAITKQKEDVYHKSIESIKDTESLMTMIRASRPKEEIKLLGDDNAPLSTSETIDALFDRHFPGSVKTAPVTDPPSTVISKDQLTSFMPFVTRTKVKRAFRQFGPLKAPGLDTIRPILIQKLPNAAWDFLTILYKASIKLGITPDSWRCSSVIFIPKGGKPRYDNASAFRPITLSTFLLKGLERILLWFTARTHFAHKPMVANQFAFMKGRSTETALSRVIDKIEQAIHNGKESVGIFLDIKGAFDNVDHDAAVSAMRRRKMPEMVINWYDHFLRNRSATVSLGGITSTRYLTRGTPQGGVLSPVIWNIVFESLLVRMSRYAFATGFADDGCILVNGADAAACQPRLQQALKVAEEWARENGLQFAPEKTIMVHFHRKQKPVRPPPTFLNRTEIPIESSTRYLGLQINSKLNWAEHIDLKIAKCKKLLFATRRFLHRSRGLQPRLVRYLWLACIRPVILYGSHVWVKHIGPDLIAKLKRLNRLAMLGMGHCHKGTPTAALELLLEVPPIHLAAEELAFSASDRIQRAMVSVWDGIGSTGRKGHLRALHDSKPTVDGDEPQLDYTIQTNWGLKAKVSTLPAKPEDVTRTEVFTDGSKLKQRVGCGYTIQQNGKEITSGKMGLPPFASVYQAELHAIQRAIERLESLSIRGPVTIHTDSLSSIFALQAQEIVSLQCGETIRAINRYGRRNDLRIHWIKAHVGNPGNERADELAKNGTLLPPQSHIALSVRSRKKMYHEHMRSKWLSLWKNCPDDYKRSRVWFPSFDPKNSLRLRKLSRKDLSCCLQWITGFCNLQRHKHVKNHDLPDLCRLCGLDKETPEHLSFYCVRLTQARVKHFRTWDGPPDSWNPFQILSFIKNTKCVDLMIDHTNYDP